MAALDRHRTLLCFLLLAAPFYLNDFASVYVGDWKIWLLIDYLAVKAWPLTLIAWLLHRGRLRPSDLGLGAVPMKTASLVIITLLAALAGTILDQNGYPLLASLPGYQKLGGMPAIESHFWNWFDLTVGLLLVGVVEELVFRGFASHLAREYRLGAPLLLIVSSILFGVIHWSAGFHAVCITTLIGAVFMLFFLRFRFLPSLMIAHFLVNFIDFSGVIPREIFRLI